MRKLSLEKYLLSHFAPSSVDSYLRTISDYLTTNPNADKAKYFEVVKYMQEVQERYNGSTPTRILAAIKKYYDYLVFVGDRNEHPCKNYTVRVKQNRSIHFDTLFTLEELEMLLNREERYIGMRERNRAMISLLIYQGLTIRELENLKTSDVDIDEGTIIIKGSLRNNKRILLMTPKQVAIMYDYLQVRSDLLQSRTDKFLMSIRGVGMSGDSINAVVESMKLAFPDRNLNPTTIRQSVIANWLNVKKKPLDEVQIMAGHKHPSSTERYIRKDIENHVQLINQFHPLG